VNKPHKISTKLLNPSGRPKEIQDSNAHRVICRELGTSLTACVQEACRDLAKRRSTATEHLQLNELIFRIVLFNYSLHTSSKDTK
jgi:hypothetical protein